MVEGKYDIGGRVEFDHAPDPGSRPAQIASSIQRSVNRLAD